MKRQRVKDERGKRLGKRKLWYWTCGKCGDWSKSLYTQTAMVEQAKDHPCGGAHLGKAQWDEKAGRPMIGLLKAAE